ncbi:YveK family protein [Halanaerobium praevalens]|uniref:Lipopolysaccharide biosynthesis protein n=1 Tax=Halanaerobium praevalens (strain ATCC 33744 / DSM 2228 / GSL) TaxID=572479 RepID=E3DS48_HALPG|nr:Wzz/FepE/Etk N-terminal domain-containing protein [Halanaerobium praevalens]ADO78196.1 lipopolysaccharide biosynthesis protein [Halanaerobium praevalens DSM 2228]
MEKEPQPNSNYYDEYEIDLREYIMLLWENKLFIGGLVVLAIITAFLYSSFLVEPVYETKARIQLSNYEGLYSDPNTVVQLLSSTDLMQEVMTDLDIDISASRLNTYINNNISVKRIGQTSIIELVVKNNEPELTFNIANNLISNFKNNSNQYFENILKQERKYISDLKSDIDNINSDLDNNQQLINKSRDAGKLDSTSLLVQQNSSLQNSKRDLRKEIESKESKILKFYSLKILDKPYSPENKISPNLKLNMAIAAVLAFMLAVFIVFFREFMRED